MSDVISFKNVFVALSLTGSLVGFKSSGQVVYFPVSFLHKNAAGNVCSEANTAKNNDFFVFWNFFQMLSDFVQWNIDSSFYATEFKFIGGSYIYQYIAVFPARSDFSPVNRFGDAFQNVFGDHAGNIYRIFGRRERWSIGVFHKSQVVHCDALSEGSRKQIDSFVNSVVAHYLCSQQFAVARSK